MPGTFGTGPNQPGVKATSTLSSGVECASQRGDGVLGKANARGRVGVHGYHGPLRQTDSASVNGSTSSFGVLGELRSNDEGAGVKGTAPLGDGVVGETSSRRRVGVFGLNHARGNNDRRRPGAMGSSASRACPMQVAFSVPMITAARGSRGTAMPAMVYGEQARPASASTVTAKNRRACGEAACRTSGWSATARPLPASMGPARPGPASPAGAKRSTGSTPLRLTNQSWTRRLEIDTNAVLAARTRAALLEGLVEIRGNLIINGIELSQLIENIAKFAAINNYVPPPPPPPQVIYVQVPAPYQPPPYTPGRPHTWRRLPRLRSVHAARARNKRNRGDSRSKRAGLDRRGAAVGACSCS